MKALRRFSFEIQGTFLVRQENALLNSALLTGERHRMHSWQKEAEPNWRMALVAYLSHVSATSRSSTLSVHTPFGALECSGMSVEEPTAQRRQRPSAIPKR